MSLAYSYLRFSSPQQATGDSIRRQTQSREAWLAAHPGVRLDTALVMTDAGRSAFRRNGLGHLRPGPVRRLHQIGKGGEGVLPTGREPGPPEPGGRGGGDRTVPVDRQQGGRDRPTVPGRDGVPPPGERAEPDVRHRGVEPRALGVGHQVRARAGLLGRKQREAGTRIVTRKLPGWDSVRQRQTRRRCRSGCRRAAGVRPGP